MSTKQFFEELKEELHLKMVTNQGHYIRIVNGFWAVDGKKFDEMSLMEKKVLDEYVTAT